MKYFLLIFAVLVAIGSVKAISVGTKNGRSGLTITWIGIVLIVTDAVLTTCYLMGFTVPLLVVFGLVGSFAIAMGISTEDFEAKEEKNDRIKDEKKDYLRNVKTSHFYGIIGLFFYTLTAILWYQNAWFQSLATASFSIICIILICEFIHPSKKNILNISSITSILLGLLATFLINKYHLEVARIIIEGILGALIVYGLRVLAEYFYKKLTWIIKQIKPPQMELLSLLS